MTDWQAKRLALRHVRRPRYYRSKVPACVMDNLGVRTQRQFRQMKRRELQALRQAAQKYMMGAAYTPPPLLIKPDYCIGEISRAINMLIKQCSVKNWGR
jgi:hypothetical protein